MKKSLVFQIIMPVIWAIIVQISGWAAIDEWIAWILIAITLFTFLLAYLTRLEYGSAGYTLGPALSLLYFLNAAYVAGEGRLGLISLAPFWLFSLTFLACAIAASQPRPTNSSPAAVLASAAGAWYFSLPADTNAFPRPFLTLLILLYGPFITRRVYNFHVIPRALLLLWPLLEPAALISTAWLPALVVMDDKSLGLPWLIRYLFSAIVLPATLGVIPILLTTFRNTKA